MDMLRYQLDLRQIALECANQYFDLFLQRYKRDKCLISEFLHQEDTIESYARLAFHDNVNNYLCNKADVKPNKAMYMIHSEMNAIDKYMSDFRYAVGTHFTEMLAYKVKEEQDTLMMLSEQYKMPSKAMQNSWKHDIRELESLVEEYKNIINEFVKQNEGS